MGSWDFRPVPSKHTYLRYLTRCTIGFNSSTQWPHDLTYGVRTVMVLPRRGCGVCLRMYNSFFRADKTNRSEFNLINLSSNHTCIFQESLTCFPGHPQVPRRRSSKRNCWTFGDFKKSANSSWLNQWNSPTHKPERPFWEV